MWMWLFSRRGFPTIALVVASQQRGHGDKAAAMKHNSGDKAAAMKHNSKTSATRIENACFADWLNSQLTYVLF